MSRLRVDISRYLQYTTREVDESLTIMPRVLVNKAELLAPPDFCERRCHRAAKGTKLKSEYVECQDKHPRKPLRSQTNESTSKVRGDVGVVSLEQHHQHLNQVSRGEPIVSFRLNDRGIQPNSFGAGPSCRRQVDTASSAMKTAARVESVGPGNRLRLDWCRQLLARRMNNGLRGRRATYMKNLAAARLAGWEKASYFEEEETGSINPKRSETEVCLNAVNTCQYGLFDGRRDVPSPDDQDLAIDSARDPSKWASTSSSGPTRTSTRPHTTICDPKPDAPAASPSSASCSARRPFRIRHGLVNCLESVNRRVVRVAPRPANSVSVTCTKARQSGRTGARSAQSSLWQRPNRPVSASLGSPAVGAQGGGGAAGRGSAEPGLPASSALETAAQSGGPGVLLTLYQILKVPVLGSRRSGKTTLIERFVNFTEPDRVPLPTMRPTYYYPVVLFNDCLVNLRLIDCPPLLGHFPVSSLDEWTDYPGWSLRSAAAFILVFDIASDDSFHYLRQLREKIIAAGTDVPMVVVANKMDVLQEARRSAKPMTSAGGGGSGSGSGWNGATNQFLNSLAAYPSGLFGLLGGNSGCSGDAVSPGGSGQLLGGTHLPTTAGLARAAPVSLQVGASGSLVYMGTGSIAGGGGGGVGSLSAGTSVNASGGYSVGGGVGAGGSGGCHTRRDLAMLVKKQWKGSVLVECSALYNWHVLRVFKELMKLIDTKDSGHKPTAAKVMQDALRRNQCSLI